MLNTAQKGADGRVFGPELGDTLQFTCMPRLGTPFYSPPPSNKPPHPPNKYSQYIIVYHTWGVFIIRGVGGAYY